MAQLGHLVCAKTLLRRAIRAFSPKEAVARARCIVAEAGDRSRLARLTFACQRLEAPRVTLGAQPPAMHGGLSPQAWSGRQLGAAAAWYAGKPLS